MMGFPCEFRSFGYFDLSPFGKFRGWQVSSIVFLIGIGDSFLTLGFKSGKPIHGRLANSSREGNLEYHQLDLRSPVIAQIKKARITSFLGRRFYSSTKNMNQQPDSFLSHFRMGTIIYFILGPNERKVTLLQYSSCINWSTEWTATIFHPNVWKNMSSGNKYGL